jgi:signal peptidase
MRSVLGWLGQVVSWLVILSVAAVLAVAVLVPRIAGATPYTVLTGSMRPHYPPGTLVVVKPIDTDDLRNGDVATYQISSGDPEVATHRIVAIGVDLKGERVFTFQGDANNAPDPKPVLPVQIRGKLWYAVPYLGYLNNALNGRQRQAAVLVVSAALLGYAAFMFVGAIRDRRRKRRSTDHPPAPGLRPARPVPVAVPEGTPLLLLAGGTVAFLLAARLIRASQGRSAH